MLSKIFSSQRVLALAPMAGVTDRPFRKLCRASGAHIAASEMVTSIAALRSSRKTQQRIDHAGETDPRIVQIAGADPEMLAETAQFNVDQGAQVIDINMGCPAKKVCNVAAGSALLKDELLVANILNAVVSAVDVPVTLKIRTGWDRHSQNGVRIAAIAEAEGIQVLAVHGRTRACGFGGQVDYSAIRDIKAAVTIPVLANGDIDSPQKAAQVLQFTGADGVMIGRAAQGNPWIFGEIAHYLETGIVCARPDTMVVRDTMLGHLRELYEFYGERAGVRIARKHIQWYCKGRPESAAFWQRINRVENVNIQYALAQEYFDRLADLEKGIAA